MNLLWVEDERRIVDEVAPFLEEEGCRVTRAESAEDALRLLARHTYDLLLLDWMLPDMPGTELCKEVQRRWRTPVIMLTAKSDEWHKVVALEIGADDYLSKPFGMRELLARIKAVLRRSGALSSAEQQALQ
ncbi:response regulator transcription factor, partial [Paenibacillus sp. 598K]|uniref:response regulator transcription factor n=1 Tax=Paenibacillus sp. 598K TaxID=1117987 RepID=UPI0021AA8874